MLTFTHIFKDTNEFVIRIITSPGKPAILNIASFGDGHFESEIDLTKKEVEEILDYMG
jgi:hypothetical protein